MTRALSLVCSWMLVFQAGATATAPAVPQQQGQAQAAEQTSQTAEKTLVAACVQPCLEDGTPVQLEFAQEVSSGTANAGDQVVFNATDDVKVGGTVVIPKGALAWGTVMLAQPKRRMARGGKLDIQINTVRLGDGEKASLRATKAGNGGGHVGAMAVGIVAAGLIFFPVAPLFLLIHGKDITYPKGTAVPVFVDGNFRLDLAKFEGTGTTVATATGNGAAASAPVAAASDVPAGGAGMVSAGTAAVATADSNSTSAAASESEVTIHSTPDDADIEVDGAFVGDTPSVLKLPVGEHQVKITKNGYEAWSQTVKVAAGAMEVAAELKTVDGAAVKP